MPTFSDAVADASEASEALRALAYSSLTFDQPAQMFGVIGDLLSGIRSLRQSLDQLSSVHAAKQSHAFDDYGDHAVGLREAVRAAGELHEAAMLIDQAENRLSIAMIAAGRIAWHPEPAPEPVSIKRWISVVFLQGEEADEVFNMIDDQGADAALNHLKEWDYGDETTDAAMENGYVYDLPPSNPLEREVRDGDYHLAYSHSFRHVGLYRLHTIELIDQLPEEPPRAAIPPLSGRASSWFEPASSTTVKQPRGLGR